MSKEEVSQAIRDYSKELTGRRDSYGSEEDIGTLTHDELMDYYEEMFDSPEALEFQAQREKEDQKFSDSQVGFEDQVHPLENSPFRQGMSRRTESVYIKEKNKMKITKKQLKRIIKEEQTPFRHVIGTAKGIFGRVMQIDEESDGNLVIVADEAEVEKHYGELMSAFPNGEMTEDGFVTGEYEDMSRAPFRESKRNNTVKVTKKQLKRIIKEEKARLAEQLGGDPAVAVFTVTMRVAVDPNAADMIYNSVEDGMDFDEETGEGIISYEITKEE